MRVLYDACVLFPASLRDFLIELATTGLFEARWTDLIHEEWIGNLLQQHADLSREKLEYTKAMINKAVLNSVITGFEARIEGLELPDKNDRHILAAAIHGQAGLIVTLNLRDFPASALESHGIRAVHPDEFILELMDMDLPRVLEALVTCQKRLKNPPRSMAAHLERLHKAGLVSASEQLGKYLDSPKVQVDTSFHYRWIHRSNTGGYIVPIRLRAESE